MNKTECCCETGVEDLKTNIGKSVQCTIAHSCGMSCMTISLASLLSGFEKEKLQNAVTAMEEKHDVILSEGQLAKMTTVGDLTSAVEAQVHKKGNVKR